MSIIRWGILGPGNIAKKFATGLAAVPDARLVAVGSRDAGRAKAFAHEFAAEKYYGSYEELVADAEVDVVYVASPHSGHCEHTLLCLNAGKAVLCEKPFAINEREALRMVECARANNLFLMEAIWMRFMPVQTQVRKWIQQGTIGEPRMVQADLGFRAPFQPESRLLNPSLGGGSLLDVGIYPLAFTSMVFGEEPQAVTGYADMGQTGVDEQAVMTLGYTRGRLAQLACGVRTRTSQAAWIYGTEGMIHLPEPFWHGTRAVLHPGEKTEVVFDHPHRANGYEYEAEEVGRCLRVGLKESPLMKLEETLWLARTMDQLRTQWGLRYPME
jgi:dihydrodiol dehydrogenase / D-xylose 1-dehydrogenase (NADP)